MGTSVIGCKHAGSRFSAIMWAVSAAIAIMAAGCGDNSAGPSGGLACADGEAWVVTKSEARSILGSIMFAQIEQSAGPILNDIDAVGIALKTDHSVVVAIQIKWTDAVVDALIISFLQERYGEDVDINDLPPEVVGEMKTLVFGMVGGKDTKGWYGMTAPGTTWSQSGNNLIMTSDGEPSEPIPFEISGTTLTITDPEQGIKVDITKRTGVNVTLFDDLLEDFLPGDGGGGGIGTGGDPNLVLGAGQAWTYSDDDEWEEGYIFTSDGKIIDIGNYMGTGWEIEAEGTYSANGSDIIIYGEGLQIPGTYNISGDILTLTILGFTEVLTKTDDVFPVFTPYKSKSRAKKNVTLPRLFSKNTR